MAEAVSVRVACRVRPLEPGQSPHLTLGDDEVYAHNPDEPRERPHGFGPFDCCFDGSATNAQLYARLAAPVLRQALQGYSGTVLAYGQTGSGKTHTMHGWGCDEAALGIVPRLSRDLFDQLAASEQQQPPPPPHEPTRFRVTASYLEIYNEQIVDLFNPSENSTTKQLSLRQHPHHGVFVQDLAQLVVRSDAELQPLVAHGNRARHIAATGMNERSSRAHTVLSLRIEQQQATGGADHGADGGDGADGGGGGGMVATFAKLNLVDLAGSERMSAHGGVGSPERMKEGCNINRSLHCLGNVIYALAKDASSSPRPPRPPPPVAAAAAAFSLCFSGRGSEGRMEGRAHGASPQQPSPPPQQPHIPYRDSKLTRLLQESLGGNAHCVMIACVSAAASAHRESVGTLQFAQRARAVRNSVRRNLNEDPRAMLVAQLRRQVARLQRQVSGQATGDGESDGGAPQQQLEQQQQAMQQATATVPVTEATPSQVETLTPPRLRRAIAEKTRTIEALKEAARAAWEERETLSHRCEAVEAIEEEQRSALRSAQQHGEAAAAEVARLRASLRRERTDRHVASVLRACEAERLRTRHVRRRTATTVATAVALPLTFALTSPAQMASLALRTQGQLCRLAGKLGPRGLGTAAGLAGLVVGLVCVGACNRARKPSTARPGGDDCEGQPKPSDDEEA